MRFGHLAGGGRRPPAIATPRVLRRPAPSRSNASLQQRRRIEDLDRVGAFGALDHAVEDIRVEPAGAGAIVGKLIGRDIGRKPSTRSTARPTGARAGDHHDARRLVKRRVRQAQQPAQADHRQDRAAQIGETEQARAAPSGMWARRRNADDLADGFEPEAERLVADAGDDQMRARRAGCRHRAAPAARRCSALPWRALCCA